MLEALYVGQKNHESLNMDVNHKKIWVQLNGCRICLKSNGSFHGLFEQYCLEISGMPAVGSFGMS